MSDRPELHRNETVFLLTAITRCTMRLPAHKWLQGLIPTHLCLTHLLLQQNDCSHFFPNYNNQNNWWGQMSLHSTTALRFEISSVPMTDDWVGYGVDVVDEGDPTSLAFEWLKLLVTQRRSKKMSTTKCTNCSDAWTASSVYILFIPILMFIDTSNIHWCRSNCRQHAKGLVDGGIHVDV